MISDNISRISIVTSLTLLMVIIMTLCVIRLQMRDEEATVRQNIERHTDEMFVIDHLFNDDDFYRIKTSLDAKKSQFIRKSSIMRSGGALSLYHLIETPIVSIFRDHDTLKKIERETGMQLQLVPRNDKNQISALLYSEIGDGIDNHYDGNVYLGTRWAGIYVISDDYDSKLLLNGIPLYVKPNSLLIFKGDKVKHQITRRTIKGERLVLNVLFCDVCAPRSDPISSLWTFAINKFGFY